MEQNEIKFYGLKFICASFHFDLMISEIFGRLAEFKVILVCFNIKFCSKSLEILQINIGQN